MNSTIEVALGAESTAFLTGDETTPITLPDRLGEDLGFGPGDAAIALGWDIRELESAGSCHYRVTGDDLERAARVHCRPPRAGKRTRPGPDSHHISTLTEAAPRNPSAPRGDRPTEC